MAEPRKRRWWSFTPAEYGVVVGIVAFVVVAIVPAIYVARYASKRPSNLRATLTPEGRRFLESVERNWTGEAALPRAFGVGLASGLAAATSAAAARAWKRRSG